MAYILDEESLKANLESAQDELVRLMRERDSIDERINKLQTDILHLAALCRVEVEDPVKQLGLTDAIRQISIRNRRPRNVQQVIDELKNSNYDLSGYKNIAANVHTVIGRLIKSGEAIPTDTSGRFFIWKPTVRILSGGPFVGSSLSDLLKKK